jgi:hypothetical protein
VIKERLGIKIRKVLTKLPFGRPRRCWEDNIKIDLRDVGWGAWTGSMWLEIGTDGGLL